MTVYSKIFYALAAIILLATGLAITRRKQVHAVLYLVVSFLGTALLFFLLGAPLVAAFEVIIYAGAIMVLFLFIIMTMRREEPKKKKERPLIHPWAIPVTLGIVSLIFVTFYTFSDSDSKIALLPAMASPTKFGQFLFSAYWLPVEIVSFLLFVALVGALYLGRHEEKSAEGDGANHGRDQVVDQKKDAP